MNTSLYMCVLCRGKFPFESIRYSKDGKSVVCVDCYSDVHGTGTKKDISEAKPEKAAAHDVINLICVDCRYKFSLRKKSRITPKCPYCGRNRLMIDNITAEKLIEEASEI